MKTLYIIRHAKSSWENPMLDDLDRPLNPRGERDAPFMAKLMLERGVDPDVIITSPASRAKDTAFIFAKELGVSDQKIRISKFLYEAYVDEICWTIKLMEKDIEVAMIFGHNPEFTSLINKFSSEYIPNIPTCGIVCINFDTNSWKTISKENASFVFFEYPKKYITKAS